MCQCTSGVILHIHRKLYSDAVNCTVQYLGTVFGEERDPARVLADCSSCSANVYLDIILITQ